MWLSVCLQCIMGMITDRILKNTIQALAKSVLSRSLFLFLWFFFLLFSMKFNAFGKSDNFFVTRFYFQCGICVVFHLKLRRLSHLFYSPWKIVLILFYYLLLFGLVVAPFKSLMSYKYSYYFQVIFKLDGSSSHHLYLPFLSCYLVCSLFFAFI